MQNIGGHVRTLGVRASVMSLNRIRVWEGLGIIYWITYPCFSFLELYSGKGVATLPMAMVFPWRFCRGSRSLHFIAPTGAPWYSVRPVCIWSGFPAVSKAKSCLLIRDYGDSTSGFRWGFKLGYTIRDNTPQQNVQGEIYSFGRGGGMTKFES